MNANHYLSDEAQSPILALSLAAASNLFTTSTTEGWNVYALNPLRLITRRTFPNSSLRIVQLLASTNIHFLVGGPPSPLYPPNKVIFWDDKLGKGVMELEFSEDVRGLAVRRDRLIVVLQRRIILYALGLGSFGVYREGVYDTTDNPKGLVALATEEGSTLLAIPGLQAGQIRIIHLPPLDSKSAPLPAPPSHDPTKTPFPSVSVISAHVSALSALTTTPSGTMVATASLKGTMIRVWDVGSRNPIRELRRGTDPAEIFGVSIRPDGGAVCVTSDKGTVHVWGLADSPAEKHKSDRNSLDYARAKTFLKPYLPEYFSSEWSDSQFRLPAPSPAPSRLPRSLANASERGVVAPTLEDDICLCTWIEVEKNESQEPKKAVEKTVDTRSASNPAKGKQREERSGPAAKSTSGKDEYQLPAKEYQVVALTTSGGYYRISYGGQPPTTPAEEMANRGPGLGKDSTRQCRLEEHRRFGSKDGW